MAQTADNVDHIGYARRPMWQNIVPTVSKWHLKTPIGPTLALKMVLIKGLNANFGAKWSQRCPKGGQMVAKWCQMEPKGAEMEPKGAQMVPKRTLEQKPYFEVPQNTS